MTHRVMVLMLCVAALSTAALGADLDTLIAGLSSPNDLEQARARQLLPYQGIEAVPKLIPLLKSPEQRVWRAAANVLSDFANETAVPGREKDRRVVVEQLMALLASEDSADVKVRVLDLLPAAVPEGYEVTAIAALLEQEALRERARECLTLIGTTQARAALRHALPTSDAAFQVALLDALAQLEDGASVTAIAPLADSPDPAVRAAAIRAVAWTGDTQFVGPARDMRHAADEATRFEATDAFLRLADGIARKGNTEAAVGMYREVLREGETPAVRGAGLAGLIRCGGATVVDDVVKAIVEGMDDLDAVALQSLENVRHPLASELIASVYAALPSTHRPALLTVMGHRGDAAFLGPLADAAAGDDPALRTAAVNGLVDLRLSGAAAAIAACAKRDADQAKTALQRMADLCANDGVFLMAGEAYVALYELAESPESRKAALEGMMKYPTPESGDRMLTALERNELTDASPSALGSLATSLAAQGRKADAEKVVRALITRANTTETVQQVIQAAPVLGLKDLPQRLGFVMAWQVVGPFPWNAAEGFSKLNINEPAIDTSKKYPIGNEQVGWKGYNGTDPAGIINLAALLGDGSDCTGYAVAKVVVDSDMDVVVRTGSDDGIKVWVNGEVVTEQNVSRGTALDQDQAPVKLRAQDNYILVEVTQGGGGWNFCLRLTKPDGTPVTFTQ